jgi:hypothetical protein
MRERNDTLTTTPLYSLVRQRGNFNGQPLYDFEHCCSAGVVIGNGCEDTSGSLIDTPDIISGVGTITPVGFIAIVGLVDTPDTISGTGTVTPLGFIGNGSLIDTSDTISGVGTSSVGGIQVIFGEPVATGSTPETDPQSISFTSDSGDIIVACYEISTPSSSGMEWDGNSFSFLSFLDGVGTTVGSHLALIATYNTVATDTLPVVVTTGGSPQIVTGLPVILRDLPNNTYDLRETAGGTSSIVETATSATTAVADSAVVGFVFMLNPSGAYTWLHGFTELHSETYTIGSDEYVLAVAYKILSATATVKVELDVTADEWAAGLVVYN